MRRARMQVFQSSQEDAQLSSIASEAAIASNLHHTNVVTTYAHDLCLLRDTGGAADHALAETREDSVFKFYLVQVRPRQRLLGALAVPVPVIATAYVLQWLPLHMPALPGSRFVTGVGGCCSQGTGVAAA